MSRIGKVPVDIPKGVTVTLSPTQATVKGPKGTLSLDLSRYVSVVQEEGKLKVTPAETSRRSKMMHGTTQRLLKNLVTGVTQGFQKELVIEGTGYRAEMKGKNCVLRLGFSHEVVYPSPDGITLATPEPTKIVVSGIDKQRVGQVAAEIRGYRPPEPYKGKGVRYSGEWIRRKAGKAGKK